MVGFGLSHDGVFGFVIFLYCFVFYLILFKISNTEEKKCRNYVWEDELN
jgi:hypothetical protein